MCLDNMNTASEMRQAKDSALHSALDQLRGKDYDHLVKEIDDIQDRSKKAYVRLYEKVGEDIGLDFVDRLDHFSR